MSSHNDVCQVVQCTWNNSLDLFAKFERSFSDTPEPLWYSFVPSVVLSRCLLEMFVGVWKGGYCIVNKSHGASSPP